MREDAADNHVLFSGLNKNNLIGGHKYKKNEGSKGRKLVATEIMEPYQSLEEMYEDWGRKVDLGITNFIVQFL